MIKNLLLSIVLTIFYVGFSKLLGNLENGWVYAGIFFVACFTAFTMVDLIRKRKTK